MRGDCVRILTERLGNMLSSSSEERVPMLQKQTTLRGIHRNVAVLCIVWIFTFTAYSALQNLEASLNPDLGVFSLACITGGGLVTCLTAPAILKLIGCKGAFVFSWICFCVFVASNYYPRTYTLILSSVIFGFSTGLLWTAQGIFITTSALNYSKISGKVFEPILSKFFGIFCMAFQSTQIWGNLISSTVLRTDSSNNTKEDFSNCGANDCPWNQPNQTSHPAPVADDNVVFVMLSIYLGCVIVGLVITIIFLKPVEMVGERVTSDPGALLTSTLRLLVTDTNMAMLVPFSLYLGVEQVLIFAEFTKSFVTCGLGIEWVGYTMICFGVCDTLGSPCVGWVCRYLGRRVLFLCATVINLAVLVVMLSWQPSQSNMFLFFLIPGLWGLADAVWQTQGAAVVGMVFTQKQEPAFANLRMFQALGFTIAYLYSNQLCQYVKLYMIGGLLAVSMSLIGVVEFRYSKTK